MVHPYRQDSQEPVCKFCGTIVYSSFTSGKVKVGQSHDVNNRFVLACKSSGVGYEQKPISSSVFTEKLSNLSDACNAALQDRIVCDIVKAKYIEDGHAPADAEVVDIAVSFDGTWHKRGHTSHTGIGVAVDILTGLVVDFEVMPNFCLICEREKAKEDSRSLRSLQQFMATHDAVCDRNHNGSSNAMEVAAAEIIWERSKDGPLRYTTMLSDGDSKAHSAVLKSNPYGIAIKKEECVNHVAKRLTHGLESLKKKSAESMGGRGGLTATLIKTLHSYYRNAIANNAGDIDAMKNAIMAAPYHVTSTDDEPDHRYCPTDGWCWFKNPIMKKSKPDLPKEMLEKLLPVYERLSSKELLDRCSRCGTQNANESLNGNIWRKCPKTQWAGRPSVQMAAIVGVMTFNAGEGEVRKIFDL